MKIAHVRAVISPEVGTLLAGYGPQDVSIAKHDELMLHGFCLLDNGKKYLVLSYDLLGMARQLVLNIRETCAKLIGGSQQDVLLSCTHTHGGPHTRHHAKTQFLDEAACQLVLERTVAAVAALQDEDFEDTVPYFYSAQVAVNTNRRYCGPENVCRMICDAYELTPLGDGVVDQEVGMLFFASPQKQLQEVVVNYAAHPLASHAAGISALSITADYPGLLRSYLGESLGCNITFISGSAGDQFPIHPEAGFTALDAMARPLATAVMQGWISAKRQKEKFCMPNAACRSMIKTFPAIPRTDITPREPAKPGMQKYDMEVQLLAIGDICLVGVPGETAAALGLEIKWHSPYRRTYICYNSTDYASYINPANSFIAGGYEVESQIFDKTTGLQMVVTAVEAMRQLCNS
ncbi:MAG: hypothetical protein E7052_03180 [Lentisphaerae bacterium]|nr:hypothetical protein [Lentisphaerota bacterium]